MLRRPLSREALHCLRLLREYRLTQTQVAEAMGLTRADLSRVINGRIDPSHAWVMRFEEAVTTLAAGPGEAVAS